MRSLKVSGGLTGGTGMGEGERAVWLLCMPACTEISMAMQSVTEVSLKTSEQHVQHKDMGTSRQKRDHQDTATILHYLKERDPSGDVGVLRSIATGSAAEPTANPERANDIGHQILHSMTGKPFTDVTFMKKNQMKTMASGTVIKANNDAVTVDPNLLFQRLTKAAEHTPNLLEDSFRYELTNVPTSLFDTHGLTRKANKASLADYIWSSTKQVAASIPPGAYSVIDGGSLFAVSLGPVDQPTLRSLPCTQASCVDIRKPQSCLMGTVDQRSKMQLTCTETPQPGTFCSNQI